MIFQFIRGRDEYDTHGGRTVSSVRNRPTENDGIPNTAGFRWLLFFLEDLHQKIKQPMNSRDTLPLQPVTFSTDIITNTILNLQKVVKLRIYVHSGSPVC